jgi:enoyl-CoA hydratase
LNEAVLDELDKVLDDLEADSEVKAIILTGAGKAFIAGADLLAMENLQGESARKFMVKGTRVFRRLELLGKPVIAALNGYTFGGGCELALCAYFRVASEKALIGMPETGLGIIPGFNGTQRLPRLIGVSRAKEWDLPWQKPLSSGSLYSTTRLQGDIS